MTVLRTGALSLLIPLAAAVAAEGAPRAQATSAAARVSAAPAQDSAKKKHTTAKKTTAKTTKKTAKSTARLSSSKTTSASARGSAASSTAPRPSATGAANAASNSAAAQSGASDGSAVKVNRFMSYNAGAKTVSLEVIAALTSQQGGFNFNGGSNGSQTITIPQGWTVRMHVKNVDAIPHSAIVIADERPLPNAPETPAIPRAYTSHVSDGLAPQNGADDVEFRASKNGTFLIYCGVPGHGPSGMYIKLVVSPDATTPSYTM